MKTSSRIFAAIFTILGICATAAVVSGASHQKFVAVGCFILAFVLYADSMSTPKSPKEV
jgi:hypothetical protein